MKKSQRQDSYINILNKYGTPQDNTTAYFFHGENYIPDIILSQQYEYNGLFSKIIDAPSEEAVKHGFELETEHPEAEELLYDTLDTLCWEEKAATAVKWARLYGGAVIVMLINDGGGLEDELNINNIKGIDGLYVYERAIVTPVISNMAYFLGVPQYYDINSYNGCFRVHASRCLLFKNGILPEHTMNNHYRFWGLPEYIRIKNELRETAVAHGLAVRLLDRSVQAIYAMKNLSNIVATDEGEEQIIKRMQLIDRARGLLSSIAIDADGESYDFKSVTFSGAKDIIDTTCNMLSAVTNIPQTLLFGRSPAGENSTGESDLENFYNLCNRIQKMMIYANLKYLIKIIFAAAYANGDIDEKPIIKIKFNPLWSLSELEQAQVEQIRASTSQSKMQTAKGYFDMGVLDPIEIRRGLAENKEFDIEKLLDDLDDEDLFEGWEVKENNADIASNNLTNKINNDRIKKDDGDKQQWITVNGTHIPIDEGQDKEEAVENFTEKKENERETKAVVNKAKGISQIAELFEQMGHKSVILEMPESLTNSSSDYEIYSKLDKNTVQSFNNAVVGKVAPNGVKVTGITVHGLAQATRRGVSLSNFEGIFDDPQVRIHPAKVQSNGQRTQKIYGTRAGIFIDIDNGSIVSIFNKDR